MSPVFHLGTHEVGWLERLTQPLFISRRRLARRTRLPRALGPWALDSGGFSELSMFGKWETTPQQYASEVRRYREEIGSLQWAAIQDWMCEPVMLAKTGLTVEEHQRRTVENYETLLSLAPDLPWAPVLQGWQGADYLRHVEMYSARGHDLTRLRTVGVGSVCRRQHTTEAVLFLRQLAALGLRLHGFGFKASGLERSWDSLVSSDSMAWSYQARRNPPLPECRHKSCANCPRFALAWQARLVGRVEAAKWRDNAQLDFLRGAA